MANVGERSDGTSASPVVLPAPGQGRRWYLLSVSCKSDLMHTIRVHSPTGDPPIWRIDGMEPNHFMQEQFLHGLPGAENADMRIVVTAGTNRINWSAVVK